jgi:ABC-type Mn2+/Zn2+ transport system ATPase subunit
VSAAAPEAGTAALLSADDAVFGYGSRAVVRLAGVSVAPAEGLGVFGPNGAGKSTLVRGLVGLLRPIAGTVRRRAGLRVGYLPQRSTLESHWPMTALDAALLAKSCRSVGGWAGRGATNAVAAAMQLLGVADLARRPFARLSGGQQQRVLLAGALADRPDLLVLDEPTDGLDLASRRRLIDALLAARREHGLSLLLVSHDLQDHAELVANTLIVHPGDDDRSPSRVELVASDALADRARTL